MEKAAIYSFWAILGLVGVGLLVRKVNSIFVDKYNNMGNVSASEDAKRYCDGYPGKADNPNLKTNLEFYKNERRSKPEGDFIDVIHQKWFGNYNLLEIHHGYIQWLFPIREDGLNHYAEQLQLHEAKVIKETPELTARAIKSYELMLDFYGMKLVDKETGKVERNGNWKDRYRHLNRSFHNYLRITRILKFLGEIGLEHYKIHFVMLVLKEIYENKELLNTKDSCLKYWATVLRNEDDRKACIEYVTSKNGGQPTMTRYQSNMRNPYGSDSEEEEEEDSDDELDAKKQRQKSPAKPAGEVKLKESDEHKVEEKKEETNSKPQEKKESDDEVKEPQKDSDDTSKSEL